MSKLPDILDIIDSYLKFQGYSTVRYYESPDTLYVEYCGKNRVSIEIVNMVVKVRCTESHRGINVKLADPDMTYHIYKYIRKHRMCRTSTPSICW